MISFSNVSKQYGRQVLFVEASFQLNPWIGQQTVELYQQTYGSWDEYQLIDSKRQLSEDLLEGGAELLLTEMKNDDLLKLVALDVHTASPE